MRSYAHSHPMVKRWHNIKQNIRRAVAEGILLHTERAEAKAWAWQLHLRERAEWIEQTGYPPGCYRTCQKALGQHCRCACEGQQHGSKNR